MYIEVKELPATIQSALKQVGYGAKDIKVEQTDTYSFFDSGHDGRRAFCYAVHILSGKMEGTRGSWGGANMFNPTNHVDLDQTARTLPPGFVVLKGSEGYDGTFCTLLTNQLLRVAAPVEPLTKLEQDYLSVFVSYVSSARKKYLLEGDRYAKREPMTQAQISEVEQSLAAKGLVKINKAGSVTITTAGKNAARSF